MNFQTKLLFYSTFESPFIARLVHGQHGHMRMQRMLGERINPSTKPGVGAQASWRKPGASTGQCVLWLRVRVRDLGLPAQIG